MSDDSRPALITALRKACEAGLLCGTSGNFSVRAESGMWITPSGVAGQGLEAADLVFVDHAGGTHGTAKASSEWRIHRDLYAADAATGSVIHAHPVHATALACQRRAIPAFHYMVAVAGGNDIRCSDYATFGSQALSEAVLAATRGRRACLMANHGLVAVGATPKQALELAVEVETLAQMYLAALSCGEPVVLDDAEMARVLEQFRDYGPARD